MNDIFKGYGKIPRWENERYFGTEKIDGTNACVVVTEEGEIYAQSRTRLLTIHDDNFGFCNWVMYHKDELLKLGVGHHFGEW